MLLTAVRFAVVPVVRILGRQPVLVRTPRREPVYAQREKQEKQEK
jgi:hypothetical protein